MANVTEVGTLSDHELQAAIAEKLGHRVYTQDEMRKMAIEIWKEQPGVQFFTEFTVDPKDDAARSRGFSSERPGDCWFTQHFSNWTGSLDQVFQLQVEIERRGLIRRFIFNLCKIVGYFWASGPWDSAWLLINATARNRAEAALLTLLEAERSGDAWKA